MKKIPTIFLRDADNRALVTDVQNPECAWVFAGEGVATRKYDGTCMRLDVSGAWWARREVKAGREYPNGYIVTGVDAVTGKTMGWESAEQSSFSRFLDEAKADGIVRLAGTYELVGPKVNGNPEGLNYHVLVAHATAKVLLDTPRTYAGLKEYFAYPAFRHEGVVFHHPDGRMAKIKVRDFVKVGARV